MNKITKHFLLLFVCLGLFSQSYLNANYTIIEDQFKERIKTPSFANVQKLKIRLDNGLEAYLVSDPEASKSAASLSVGVGWAQDPEDIIGMAHFVEHMLFQGTEEYPEEHSYQEFIENNGGMANAFTVPTQTCYMFDIFNKQFPEALKRFSSFFKTPLFVQDSLERERKAVNEEFLMRLNQDEVREFLVTADLSKLKFNCGNLETLGEVVQEDLMNWYEDHYSSNLMKLSIYSSLPMNEIVTLVDKNFSGIKNKNYQKAFFETPALDSNYLGQFIYVEPIKDQKRLTLEWELPSEFANDLENHTGDLLGYVLTQDNENSLASYLKEKGWVNFIYSGAQSYDDHLANYVIKMDLTESGITEINQVIESCFQSINNLRKHGIPDYLFDEMVSNAKLAYQFQSRQESVSATVGSAYNLQNESLETYPEKTSWPTYFDKEKMNRLLNFLKADNCLYIVMAPSGVIHKDFNKTEEYNIVNYAVSPVSKKQLSTWNNKRIKQHFSLPSKNPYIPDNLNLIQAQSGAPILQPEVVAHTEKTFVYYSPDNKFQSPKSFFSIYLNSPSMQKNVRSEVFKDLHEWIYREKLAGMATQAYKAGLECSIQKDPNLGLNIGISGYSQKAFLYLKEVMAVVKSYIPKEAEFDRYKEFLLRNYENNKLNAPMQIASETLSSVINKNYISDKEKIEALKAIDYEDMQVYLTNLFDKVYIRALLYGNLTRDDAKEISNYLTTDFKKSKPFPLLEQERQEIISLNNNTKPSFITAQTQLDGNSTILMIAEGEVDFHKQGLQQILGKALNSAFSDELRTKQQTGYIAYSVSQEKENQLFSFFVVQSNNYSNRDLLARFELFNEEFLRNLGTEEFDEEKFLTIKESALEELKKPLNNINEMGMRLNIQAFEYDGDFNRIPKRIEALEKVTFEDFIAFAKQSLGRSNPKRIAVLVDGKMSDENTLNYKSISDLKSFKGQTPYSSRKILAHTEVNPD